MHATTLVVTLVMAVIYLLAIRIIDFNEKEPIWAVLMCFVFGGAAAVVLLLAVPTAVLEGIGAFSSMGGIAGVMAKELARFLAVGAGFGVLGAVAKSRGFSEVNGLMDGVVYGSAGGLGYATGLAFGRDVLLPSVSLGEASVVTYGQLALIGLSDGLFGALMGIGFAAALMARGMRGRVGGPILGFLAAVGAHATYDYIANANSLASSGAMRKWVALLLPVVIVIVVVFVALGGEKRAIAEELGAEEDTGAVTKDDLAMLQSMMKREVMYMKALFSGDLGRYAALHGLHNRQVQLAMIKRRASGEQDDERRQSLATEIARLRAAVFEFKQTLGADIPAPTTTPAAVDAPPETDSDEPPETDATDAPEEEASEKPADGDDSSSVEGGDA